MEQEELRELFCVKIGLELGRFKNRILKLEPEEIYGRAYQIDAMVAIYEELMEESREFSLERLRWLAVYPGLLITLYRRWQKTEDSHAQELRACILEGIAGMGESIERKEEAA